MEFKTLHNLGPGLQFPPYPPNQYPMCYPSNNEPFPQHVMKGHFSTWFLFAYVMWLLRLEFLSWPHLLLISHSALKMELMLPQSIPEWLPELQHGATTMTAGVPTVHCSHLLHLMLCWLLPSVNLWVKARIHVSLFSVSSRDPEHRTCFQSILFASMKIQKYVLYLSPAKETVSYTW